VDDVRSAGWLAVAGSPVIVNGDEFENIELKQSGSELVLSQQQQQQQRSTTSIPVLSVAGAKRDLDNNIAASAESGPIPPPPLDADRQRGDSSSGYTSESGDMLRELVKNKDQMEMLPPRKKAPPVKMGSADSEVSDTSNLVTTACSYNNNNNNYNNHDNL